MIDRDELRRKAAQVMDYNQCHDGLIDDVASAVHTLLDELAQVEVEAERDRLRKSNHALAGDRDRQKARVDSYMDMKAWRDQEVCKYIDQHKVPGTSEGKGTDIGSGWPDGQPDSVHCSRIQFLAVAVVLYEKRQVEAERDRLREQLATATGQVQRLRTAIQDALPYVSDSHARITLTNVLEETK